MNPRPLFDEGPIDLSAYDEDYRRQERPAATERPVEDVPDGYYDTVVEDVRLGRTPTTQNPMVIWKLRIIGPSYTGQSLTKTRIITPKTLAYVKEDLAHLGVVLERFSDLGERLAEMIECETGVYKRQGRNGWTDIYFTKRQPSRKGPRAEQAQAAAAAATGTDDDLPF